MFFFVSHPGRGLSWAGVSQMRKHKPKKLHADFKHKELTSGVICLKILKSSKVSWVWKNKKKEKQDWKEIEVWNCWPEIDANFCVGYCTSWSACMALWLFHPGSAHTHAHTNSWSTFYCEEHQFQHSRLSIPNMVHYILLPLRSPQEKWRTCCMFAICLLFY